MGEIDELKKALKSCIGHYVVLWCTNPLSGSNETFEGILEEANELVVLRNGKSKVHVPVSLVYAFADMGEVEE